MQALFLCQIERMVHSSRCISLYFILLVTFTTVSSVLTPESYPMVHLTPVPHYPPVLVAHLSLVLVPHTGLAGPILAQAKAQKSCLPRTSPYRCIQLASTIFPAVHWRDLSWLRLSLLVDLAASFISTGLARISSSLL